MNMKTFRRDKLRRLIEAGKVTLASSYHFDDMTGEHHSHTPMPVAMKPADWHDRKEGICYLGEWDFTTKSGCCYESGNGIVTLIVHGNSSYDFRVAT
jgi:hypothetical protein